ncbi:MAG: FAD-binding oxidoreductase [Actinomycetes bacterium]
MANLVAGSTGSAPAVDRAGYELAAERMRAQVAGVPPGGSVRLAKRTSNVFRARAATPGLDVSGLAGVLSVAPDARTADVLGMTTYEDLVDATLAYGLMPLVVPQLKTITLGGAVTGLGIESSSFRNGLPHESVLDMDVLTGDARLLTVTPDGEHAPLFYGFPNSYGSLGYALRLRIELQPVLPYVLLTHERHDDAGSFVARLDEVCRARSVDGAQVDFVDGTIFSPDEHYLTLGTFVDEAPYTSDYTGQRIYYRSLQQRRRDFLTVRDYLWRWDTDWFWCSRALGVQRPAVRRLVPRRYMRSDVYMKFVGFERRHQVAGRVDRWRGRPPREVVVQDVEVPIERTAEFLDFFHREIGIEPIWVCPLLQRDPDVTWELYAFDPRKVYVNIGFWSSVELAPGQRDGDHNRRIEEVVAELGGRKSLYSTAYYDEDTFWATYNGPAYQTLKKTYDPDGRFADLYDKTVRQR